MSVSCDRQRSPAVYNKIDKEETEASTKLHNKVCFFSNLSLKFPFSRERPLMTKLKGVMLYPSSVRAAASNYQYRVRNIQTTYQRGHGPLGFIGQGGYDIQCSCEQNDCLILGTIATKCRHGSYTIIWSMYNSLAIEVNA